MRLDRIENADVILLVHLDDISLRQILILVVDLEPVRAGLGHHRYCANSDRCAEDGTFIHAMPLGELVGEFLNRGVRNSYLAPLVRSDFHSLILIAEGEKCVDLSAFVVGDFDVVERRFFC